MSRLTTTVFVEIRSFPSSVFVISAIFVRILHPIPKNRKYRLSPPAVPDFPTLLLSNTIKNDIFFSTTPRDALLPR